jgi:hypothetical protein
VTPTAAIALVLNLDLSAIASLGSAVALVVFALLTVGHLRLRRETGARTWLLVLALATTVVVLASFALTTLMHEPATTAVMAVILALSVALDLAWTRHRGRSPTVTTGEQRRR